MRRLIALAAIGLAACTAGGGGGGSTPDCLSVGGFSQHFEQLDDGAWPVCEDGSEAFERVDPEDGRHIRGCDGTEHGIVLDEAGVALQWRWDGPDGHAAAHCVDGHAINVKTHDAADPVGTCNVECWDEGCEGYPDCPEQSGSGGSGE